MVTTGFSASTYGGGGREGAPGDGGGLGGCLGGNDGGGSGGVTTAASTVTVTSGSFSASAWLTDWRTVSTAAPLVAWSVPTTVTLVLAERPVMTDDWMVTPWLERAASMRSAGCVFALLLAP